MASSFVQNPGYLSVPTSIGLMPEALQLPAEQGVPWRRQSEFRALRQPLSGLPPRQNSAKCPVHIERLLASFERITGKSFGAIPMNPTLSSSTVDMPILAQRHQDLLATWAQWWDWEPPEVP